MSRALIGYTGFVGGNLLRQTAFDVLYNSANIDQIAGRSFDLLVCSAMPAEKWKANQDPVRDQAVLEQLTGYLRQVSAQRLLLISTVDVYPDPRGVDESSIIQLAQTQPYGKHRLMLEQFVSDHFQAQIVRLPGLFGRGLKKNIIYDFLHGNAVDRIHADSCFQFYDLENLWSDIERARLLGIDLINLATEPVSVHAVAKEAFDMAFENRPAQMSPASYDFRSQHAAHWGGRNGYLYDREQVLSAMRRFVLQAS